MWWSGNIKCVEYLQLHIISSYFTAQAPAPWGQGPFMGVPSTTCVDEMGNSVSLPGGLRRFFCVPQVQILYATKKHKYHEFWMNNNFGYFWMVETDVETRPSDWKRCEQTICWFKSVPGSASSLLIIRIIPWVLEVSQEKSRVRRSRNLA